ncbi:MAG: hypothetical protein H8D26_05595 [Methanomicrobia archaeon]|nr:hypothetical protein [Methanomicrobia archaeon]
MVERERIHDPYHYLFWSVVLIIGGLTWYLSIIGVINIPYRLFLPLFVMIIGFAILLIGILRIKRKG